MGSVSELVTNMTPHSCATEVRYCYVSIELCEAFRVLNKQAGGECRRQEARWLYSTCPVYREFNHTVCNSQICNVEEMSRNRLQTPGRARALSIHRRCFVPEAGIGACARIRGQDSVLGIEADLAVIRKEWSTGVTFEA